MHTAGRQQGRDETRRRGEERRELELLERDVAVMCAQYVRELQRALCTRWWRAQHSDQQEVDDEARDERRRDEPNRGVLRALSMQYS